MCLIACGWAAIAVWISVSAEANRRYVDRSLIEAIYRDDAKGVTEAIKRGANPNATDKPYVPVTLTNVVNECWERIRTHGALATTTGDPAHPPALILAYELARAREAGDTLQLSLMQRLLEGGADPNIKSADGNPLLTIAASCSEADLTKLLLEHHANPNLQGRSLFMPFYSASPACQRLLLLSGANVNVRDWHGNTPIMVAYDTEVLQMLIDRGADVNAQNDKGDTALFRRPFGPEQEEADRFLLQHGALASIRNNEGHLARYELNKQLSNPPMSHYRSGMRILHMLDAALEKEPAGTNHQRPTTNHRHP